MPKNVPKKRSRASRPEITNPDPGGIPSHPPLSPQREHPPFKIRLLRDASLESVLEEVPARAGCFYLGSTSSFSSSSFCRPRGNFRTISVDSLEPSMDSARSETHDTSASGETMQKAPVTHPNSITKVCNAGMAPFPKQVVKRSGDGNFVKMNLNRMKKFRGKNSKFRRPLRKGRFFRRKNGDGDAGSGNSEEEFALTMEEDEESARPKEDSELSEATRTAREDPSDENLRNLLKLTHGFDYFREGQLEAIKRVLALESTMLVLPTGTGKSLCYQLPALIFPGMTLIVSPLVSLMIDQLRNLPPVISGGLLSSNQTSKESAETLERVRSGAIKVLFVSPERLLNPEFISIFACEQLITLMVIDEAHCLSEWSHNFRPSYMRLKASILRDKLKVKCFLAMTATAAVKPLHSIMSALEISHTNLVQTSLIRENLQLSVTSSENRLKDLLTIMKSPQMEKAKSIIVYCKFQYETDLVCKFLSDNKISAKSYHSGLHAKDRNLVQKLFCSNNIKVVAATVAFGMGLDKGDVGAVIHYSLPGSIEEYVQEIGRAGRDGGVAFCHLLLDDSTYLKLRSLAYSDGVDEYTVNKFLSHVFGAGSRPLNKIHTIVIEGLSVKLDMKEEVMSTILTHLEVGEVKYLQLLPQTNATCKLRFHKTPPSLLAVRDALIASILKSDKKQGDYVFDISDLANTVAMTPSQLIICIQRLKSMGEVSYELKDPCFCFELVKQPEDLCALVTYITQWLSEVEKYKIWRLDEMFSLAYSTLRGDRDMEKCKDSSHWLHNKIVEYFEGHHDYNVKDLTKFTKSSPYLRADIKVFLQANSHAKFTPRAVARILHGISSPGYPASTWSKTHFWGRYTEVDFLVVKETASAELINLAGITKLKQASELKHRADPAILIFREVHACKNQWTRLAYDADTFLATRKESMSQPDPILAWNCLRLLDLPNSNYP